MQWNWQNTDWPNFRYDAASIVTLEQNFLQSAGGVIDAIQLFIPPNWENGGNLKRFIAAFVCFFDFRFDGGPSLCSKPRVQPSGNPLPG